MTNREYRKKQAIQKLSIYSGFTLERVLTLLERIDIECNEHLDEFGSMYKAEQKDYVIETSECVLESGNLNNELLELIKEYMIDAFV